VARRVSRRRKSRRSPVFPALDERDCSNGPSLHDCASNPNKSIATAERTGKPLAVRLGCPGSGTRAADRLRRLPLATTLNVQQKLAVSSVGPSVGGPDLPRQPRTPIGSIPMLLGGNTLERGLSVALIFPSLRTTTRYDWRMITGPLCSTRRTQAFIQNIRSVLGAPLTRTS
jgi:hypothetical protein